MGEIIELISFQISGAILVEHVVKRPSVFSIHFCSGNER